MASEQVASIEGVVQDDSGKPSCRFCGAHLRHTFVDLGMTPLCESFLTPDQLNGMEPYYPLHVHVCDVCFLVQLEEYVAPEEIFTEYAYFSSYSDAWLKHAEEYVDMAARRFGLDESSRVVELASNDGYLLQYFVERGIPALGIEPAKNVVEAAEARGVPTLVEFFGRQVALEERDAGRAADLIVANNVLAQVPDLNDFVAGIKILLAPGGVVTMEVPHLLRLMEENQFDTIYHEHFSYFSATTIDRILQGHGLRLFDVDELWTHGGSIRAYGAHEDTDGIEVSDRTRRLLDRERELGLSAIDTYLGFGERTKAVKRTLLSRLIDLKEDGKRIVGYGAAGKGNTLLNYCGIGPDFLDYIADRNPYKHGRFTPGTHIPIVPPDEIARTRPDCVLILPWNLRAEIMDQLSYIRDWGGRFVVPIPQATIEA